MTLAECGISEHPDECLCDVVITNPVPVNYLPTEVWHANVIARATGYKEGSGGSQLADFLEALAHGYDATRRIANLDEGWLDGTSTMAYRQNIKKALRAGVSIIDLPDMLQDSFARIVAAITMSNPSVIWTWPESRWAEFEDELATSDDHNPQALCNRYGITDSQAKTLLDFYGKGVKAAPSRLAHARARELFSEHPEATIPEIRKMLEAEGHKVADTGLYKTKAKMKRH